MKLNGNRLYFLLLAVVLLLIFLYQYYTPEEFVWRPTFSKYDKQPFGSYVFDDVLSSSVEGYQVVNRTFYQLLRETEDTDLQREELTVLPEEGEAWEEPAIEPLPPEARRAILVTENHADFSEADTRALQMLLQQGNRVMLCLNSFGALCETFGFSETYDMFGSSYARGVKQYARKVWQRDSLLLGVDSLHPEKVYAVFPHMHPNFLKEGVERYHWETPEDSIRGSRLRCDSSRVLVRNGKGGIVAWRLFIGEGELFLVATPLMFTNYGLLDGENASYAFRLLSCLKGFPLMRTEAYGVNNARSESPLRYLLSQPPLQWALYVTLATLLLCMFFAARRRQWVIPVVRPPVNETLRFTQLIGNLYYQRNDCKDLLCKKYLYFCNEVKQLSGFDMQSGEPDREINDRLADLTGQDASQIWPAFRELKYHLREHTPVSEEEMMRHIDRMNEWRLMMSPNLPQVSDLRL
ncbi:MAG: DUF4350 domain-containing protein [Tannerella sp.]|jgi:hypothetical protein|nr:DUF4350 domain-containing protein [Tannerella sp.]